MNESNEIVSKKMKIFYGVIIAICIIAIIAAIIIQIQKNAKEKEIGNIPISRK